MQVLTWKTGMETEEMKLFFEILQPLAILHDVNANCLWASIGAGTMNVGFVIYVWMNSL